MLSFTSLRVALYINFWSARRDKTSEDCYVLSLFSSCNYCHSLCLSRLGEGGLIEL
jgi:hypothetical protein